MNLGDFTWVFIGCGGTFYGAAPYLSVLWHRHKPKRTIFIDPDYIEDRNAERQWPTASAGTAKTELGADAVSAWSYDEGEYDIEMLNSRFDEFTLANETGPILAIVNVDNNPARLAVRSWLDTRQSMGIMVVSGCQHNYGQVYYGVWQDGPIHDWLPLHDDVNNTDPPRLQPGGCGGQTISANVLTGQFVGVAIEDIERQLSLDGPFAYVTEWYWKTDTADKNSVLVPTVKAWTQSVPAFGEENND